MMKIENIRNFSIIAHIDHGKSTLADRMLEITNTIEKRKMKNQLLDSMELERERGITIKMQPVSMTLKHNSNEYLLNMIDTPGHIDFSYEVSRTMKAIEGCLLLVDSTQGIQAQTLSVLDLAKEMDVKIIPVLSKIDSKNSRIEEVKKEVIELIKCSEDEILLVSGKTGEGVKELLERIIEEIPAPKDNDNSNKLQGIVFDSSYTTHTGIILHTRLFSGSVKTGDSLFLPNLNESLIVKEVGIFSPEREKRSKLEKDEIGYIVSGIKKANIAVVGETILNANSKDLELSGYKKPEHVIWASIYPESQDDLPTLIAAFERLHLEDVSFSFEEESSLALGKGFRCGFLGMLHLEIITERIQREFDLSIVITTPTTPYRLIKNEEESYIYSPMAFPENKREYEIWEPWIRANIVSKKEHLNILIQLFVDYEAVLVETENFGNDRLKLTVEMPLREIMRNFFDKLKSATSGYGSISYKIIEERIADVSRLDLHIAEEIYPAFSRIISRQRVGQEAKNIVNKIYDNLPKQMFVTKIQAYSDGKIISSKTLSALRKDVTAKLYGGDVTRKMKLKEKQKKGKSKRKEFAKVKVPHSVFLKVIRN